ncbi:cytochrome P450 [Amycolatopsis japonica]
MARLLSPRALRSLRQPFLRAAESLVDKVLAEDDGFDGVSEIAEAFPLTVFPDVVGLGEDVREHLLPYGDLVFNFGGPMNELAVSALRRGGGAVAAVDAQTRRVALRDNGIGAQIWQAVDAGELPAEEAPLLVRSLLTAGVDTTVSAIGAALHALATNPDQWQLLRDDPRRARFAFEEAIRVESPVQTFYRTSVRETDLAGASLPADVKVYLSLGAANHDPRRFEEPDRFDLTRETSGHVGFGVGIHHCVGQHLGRLEGEAILTALAGKVKSIGLAGTPVRRLNNSLRSWASLPLVLAAA